MTLQQCLTALGCTKCPQEWEGWLEEAQQDARTLAPCYFKKDFYQSLQDRFGLLKGELPYYLEALEETVTDEALCLYLALLCRTLTLEWDSRKAALHLTELPKAKDSLGFRMVWALAMCTQAEGCYRLLKQRGLEEDLIRRVLALPAGSIDLYRLKNQGKTGFDLLSWFQLAVDGRLFPIGGLEFEIRTKFHKNLVLLENANHQRQLVANGRMAHKSGMPLGSRGFEDPQDSFTAQFTQTQDAYLAHPVVQGRIVPEITVYPKSQWRILIQSQEPVMDVHIPLGAGLTPEAVDQSMAAAQEFFRRYYPEYSYKALCCSSWLMDPTLTKLLGRDCNISTFQRRFEPAYLKSDGSSVLHFVMHDRTLIDRPQDMPENTRLFRELKKHYLSGSIINDAFGYCIL